jgi:hypothetical protein
VSGWQNGGKAGHRTHPESEEPGSVRLHTGGHKLLYDASSDGIARLGSRRGTLLDGSRKLAGQIV